MNEKQIRPQVSWNEYHTIQKTSQKKYLVYTIHTKVTNKYILQKVIRKVKSDDDNTLQDYDVQFTFTVAVKCTYLLRKQNST